jgi:hypothetical protein
MAKEIPALRRAEVVNNASYPATRRGMLGGFAQMRIEFAEGQFDWMEVGRIFRAVRPAPWNRSLRQNESMPTDFVIDKHLGILPRFMSSEIRSKYLFDPFPS